MKWWKRIWCKHTWRWEKLDKNDVFLARRYCVRCGKQLFGRRP